MSDWQERYADAVHFVTHDCPRTDKKAFNDYLGWMLLWAESLGKYLWDTSHDPARRKFDARALFTDYLQDMAEHDVSARVTGDPVMSCLESLRHQAVAIIRPDRTDDRRRVHLGRLRGDANGVSERRGGQVIDRQVRADALFVRFEMGGQDLSSGQLHVMGHRPRRVQAVHDRAVERGTHVLGHDRGHLSLCADLERRLHVAECSGTPLPNARGPRSGMPD